MLNDVYNSLWRGFSSLLAGGLLLDGSRATVYVLLARLRLG